MTNEVCEDCLKWKKFGNKCSVYWEGKKWCTLKVVSMDDWRQQEMLLGRY